MAYGRTRKRLKLFFKNINYTRIFIRALVIFFIACFSWICSDKLQDGILFAGVIQKFFAYIYNIFTFPFIFLLYRYAPRDFYLWETYFICFFLNAYLFAVVIGIIRYLFSLKYRFRKNKDGALDTNITTNDIFLFDMIVKMQRAKRAKEASSKLSYRSRKLLHSSRRLSFSSRKLLHSSRRLSPESLKFSHSARKLSLSTGRVLLSSRRAKKSFRKLSHLSNQVETLSSRLSHLSHRIKVASKRSK